MEHIRQTFVQCQREGRPALVAYVTAGFPTAEETPDIMLGMQAGGVDIIELGLPFTDPIADSPAIQKSNLKALQNGVTINSMLKMVREARQKGLRTPVLFMGYYNPLLRYGESKILADCKLTGVNGFIIGCVKTGLSYIPLIAPSTMEDCMRTLCGLADSFIYLVSRMGVTSTTGSLNPELPALIRQAKGQVIMTLNDAPAGKGAQAVEEFYTKIMHPLAAMAETAMVVSTAEDDATVTDEPGRFGIFGGQYAPEALRTCLAELKAGFQAAHEDPTFWEEFGPTWGRDSHRVREIRPEVMLGATIVPVESGSRMLRDAVNEAFHSVIGNETRAQMAGLGKKVDAVVACVGGGSNAVGMLYPFSQDASVQLFGVEAAGDGLDSGPGRHSATLSGGSIGVLHGVRTYILQDQHGQVESTHSVSVGLDYPGVGPELAYWKESNRAMFLSATDAQALQGFRLLGELEGIIPVLETSHTVWGAVETAKKLGPGNNLVLCLSGRGDRDVQTVAEVLPRLEGEIGWDLRF
ncbi:tryptophan synthase beta subunit-like PLP-dependent enzyme [Aspergillus falconensis]